MNKTQFVNLVKETGGFESKKAAKNAVNCVINAIIKALAEGESVEFVGFGKFYVAKQSAREAKVPGTDRIVKVPEKNIPKFKPGKALRDIVNHPA